MSLRTPTPAFALLSEEGKTNKTGLPCARLGERRGDVGTDLMLSGVGCGLLMLEENVAVVCILAKDNINMVTSGIRYKRLTETLTVWRFN